MPAPASVLETKLVITDAFGSAIFSFFGVKAATVGQELNCVRMLMRCWALVAFAAWPTQKRMNSMFGLGAEAGMINARVVVLITVELLMETTNSRMNCSFIRAYTNARPVHRFHPRWVKIRILPPRRSILLAYSPVLFPFASTSKQN